MGGFSDYYVRLPESLQDEILARTEREVQGNIILCRKVAILVG